ncbi:hypothetical protein [Actinokineospora iranica]|uniref:Scaffolding protein n=1 Tax=Actinokineospora iranica TaxID=1271860 RepID=A0A1G6Y8C7_9PSEU|nr:hypothetical protein [Actinokineospora iranica]SDD86552.1 hypothetical protein SAMN05216174_12080 [Actinokineospora iranica]
MSAPIPTGAETAPTDPAPPTEAAPTEPAAGSTTAAPSPAPEVEALRAEIADWQSKAEGAQQSIVDRIAAALGIAEAGETPTVEQVTEQLGAAQRDARERAVDLAVYRAAPTAGADPDALLDSTGFRRRVADLDPSAEKFGDQVAAAIAETVKAHPRLAAAPAAAPRSGSQITGGSPTGSDDLGSLSVEDYIKRTRKRK